MPQLLVRDVDEAIVRELKRRAAERGVSAEEEHRRLLREALAKPTKGKPSLMEFLVSTEVNPKVELDLERSRDTETRDTGF